MSWVHIPGVPVSFHHIIERIRKELREEKGSEPRWRKCNENTRDLTSLRNKVLRQDLTPQALFYAGPFLLSSGEESAPVRATAAESMEAYLNVPVVSLIQPPQKARTSGLSQKSA